MVWGGISIKHLIGSRSFKTIMNGSYTTFKIISLLMQEDNLVDNGDYNSIMILNITVD